MRSKSPWFGPSNAAGSEHCALNKCYFVVPSVLGLDLFVAAGPVNDVPGVTRWSAMLDWLSPSFDIDAVSSSRCDRWLSSPQESVSASDGSSKPNSEGNWSIAEQILSKCFGIHMS